MVAMIFIFEANLYSFLDCNIVVAILPYELKRKTTDKEITTLESILGIKISLIWSNNTNKEKYSKKVIRINELNLVVTYDILFLKW